MQMTATIMRLVVILSVLVQIYANTNGQVALLRGGSGGSGGSDIGGSKLRSLLGAGATDRPDTGTTVAPGGFRAERNIYRTKLSRLRLILLADMLNEIPPPQLELITCLANSTTLNVTTKHCDCETYSCKDLLASSTPSPFNHIQPKRKIHTSCREHCCRKKKFNRSIDPAVLENVVGSPLTSSSSPSAASTFHSLAPAGRHNVDASSIITSPAVHRSPSVVSLTAAHHGTMQSPGRSGSTLRLPSPAPAAAASGVRDHRDHRNTPSCSSEQISISSNGTTIIPWLYRVGLIETKHPLCAGALIHPSLILTTAVCVINKTPEELLVWNGAGSGEDADVVGRPVGRILLPEQFATTFERLEHNVALLQLLAPAAAAPKDKQPPAAPGRNEPATTTDRPMVPIGINTGSLRAWPLSKRSAPADVVTRNRTEARAMGFAGSKKGLDGDGPEPAWRRRNPAKTELFRAERKRTPMMPASICLSSIIEHEAPVAGSFPRCNTVSFHRRKRSSSERTNGSDTDPRTELPDDGTNYVTTNISIFPATACRPEHREYLQHGGNLCAGFAGMASNRSIDVDFSGSPLICDELQADGSLRRAIRGLLTWSTDINHAPHLFTNLTTYRPWIERQIERLEAMPASAPSTGPIILRSKPYPLSPSVLYG